MKHLKASRGKRKLIAAVLATLCLAVVFGIAGCGSNASSSAAGSNASKSASSSSSSALASSASTVQFTDSAGRTVEVPANIERVAITGPISQMCMLTLAPEKLVGLSNELSGAEIKYLATDVSNLPVLGQIYGGKGDFNKEAVANADPQVVIDIGEAKKSIVEDLDGIQESIGIPCIHIEATYNTYDQAYKQLGELLGVQDRAKVLADYCSAAVKSTDEVVSSIPDSDRVKVAYLLGDSGLNAMAKGSFQATVVDAIADNVAVIENPGGSGMGSETSFEQIAMWNPQMIVFAPGSIYDTAASDSSWQTLSAISGNNYYAVPGEPYNWLSSPPGVNQVLGYQWFAHLCYPEKFKDSIEDMAKNYYKTFYNYEMSDTEVAALLAGSVPKQ